MKFIGHGWPDDVQDDLVGKIDQHEEEEKGGHAPGPREGPNLCRHSAFAPCARLPGLVRPLRQVPPPMKRAPTGALFDRCVKLLLTSCYLMRVQLPSFS